MKPTSETVPRAKELYRTLVERSPDPMWVSRDGILLFVNAAAVRLFGAGGPGDLIGTSVLERVHPAFREVGKARLDSLARGAAATPLMAMQFLKFDGTAIDVEIEGTSIEFDGAPAAYAAVRDISARKRAEDALRDNQRRLRTILDTVGDPIFVTDADHRIIVANQAYCDMFGLDQDNVIGTALSETVPEVERTRVLAVDRQVLSTGIPDVREETLLVGDLTRTILTRKTRFVEHTGERFLVGSIHDITERKAAERQARANQELLDAVIDSSPSNIFAVDREQRYTLVNAAVAASYGMTKQEVLGKTAEDLFKPRDAAAIRDANERIMATGKAESREEVVHHRTGDVSRIVLTSKFPLRNEHGTVTGLAGVVTDMTAQRISEAERSSLAAQLQQAQKMESVGRLAGGVAHDFNNMLGVILGHAELALMQLDAAHPVHEDLTEIRAAATRSADLTRQLLAFARKQVVEPAVLDLNASVDHSLKMLQRMIGEAVTLEWRPAAELWPVRMDPSQIDQLLANLCVNARDAIVGTGTLRIATVNRVLDAAWCASHAGAAPGEYVQLTVKDDGKGMTGEVLAHLFEPFFTTKKVGEGTGLGLATVYGIVKQNDGFIAVVSEPGRGAAFDIFLPRYTGALTPASTGVAATPMALGRETILLAEDEPAVRRVAARTLRAQGYSVLEAEGPHDALRMEAAHSGVIDLLLTDMVMPGMSGRELAKRLLAARPHVRLMFMSGYPAAGDAGADVEMNDAPFLAKPFSLAALTLKVREVLDSE